MQKNRNSLIRSLLIPATLLALCLFSQTAWSQVPVITSTPAANGGQNYVLSIQTLLILTSLSFLPAVLLMMTSFTRIVIVLSMLRQAIGTASSPPNQVIIGLSLFLTMFVMSPVIDKIYADAYQPFNDNKISFSEALERGSKPLKEFMMKQTRQADLALYVKLSRSPKLNGPEEVPLTVLIPAYITSELKTAFQISFAIFIPFLIIDMVVAIVLMSMGMMMMSPATISLPFKIMLFVLVDGWQLLMGSLAQSFY
ncbi:flagellar biosynthetic protein FliP [Oxalobacteraceae bacterium GrIS 2.11]